MKIFKLSSKLFASAFVLLVITNAVMLLGVYLNRSSEATSEVTLTQRELQLPSYIRKENNSVSLRLVYRTANKSSRSHQDNFLNHDKLEELGFDTDKYLYSKESTRTPTKEVFIVLENNGELYKKSLKSAEAVLMEKEALYNANKDDKKKQRDYENAKNNFTREQISQSRLFAIDAGLEYEGLRQKYPNKTDYLIVKGVVGLVKDYKEKILYGYIQRLNVQTVHLPYKFKYLLKEIGPINSHNNTRNTSLQYKVEVKYGSRYEPFITSVKRIY
ncbi:DUF4824 family protein [Sulfurimonas crateris]|uniref:DUF4824 family protein n=1 Tax=Sulfurimonas crateris TaxID=2574727 RepID=A0A4U2ZAA6_9BACT|nr:DUF4824 family protein [Sulfurimonas crateris]TKI70440.1 DUF4824 family protein [Sulfurimonas crateris]